MSDEAARAIDPRFDPRYQRGYTPGVHEVPTAVPEAPREAQRVEREPGGRAAATEAAVARKPQRGDTAIVSDEQAHDHAAALLAYFGRETGSEAVGSTGGPPRGARIEAPPAAAGQYADSGMAELLDASVTDAEHESESPFVRHPSLAFWVSLASSIAFVLIGAVLYWNVNLEQMQPGGRIGGEDQAFLSTMHALGLGLVQAGVLGIVVVLALWSVQVARGRRS
ncbi:hypothetical protein [Agromyces salentinus]|uniref:Uncharacterized protein n=1 Tax=Agromyces salentinus TaxID=269421 RepID=A0ABN2MVR6_9MICO|nr:hypothetical protein [Agromyces salentinus]